MTSSSIQRVREIAADIFDLPLNQVTPQSSPESLPNWDSIKHLDLVLAVEQEFNVRLETEEIEKMTSIARVAAALDCKLQQHG
jgi:acyl carrier protein